MHTYYFKYFESILILGPSCKSSLWMPGVQWHTVGHDCQKWKETHIRPRKEKKWHDTGCPDSSLEIEQNIPCLPPHIL